MAEALDSTAIMQFMSGEIDRADVLYQESLSLAREAGHRLVVARAIGGLALVAAERGQADTAIGLMQERLERMGDLGLESEVRESQNLLCGVYVLLKRYDEAALLADTHPMTSAAFWVAEAHVGAGAYEKSLNLLPSLTTKALSMNTYYLAACMIPWAMLLVSDCPLDSIRGEAGTAVLFPCTTRLEKAVEILSLLSAHDRCWGFTRRRANELLAELRAQSLMEQREDMPSRTRPIEELAQEMLAIRIRR